MSYIFNAASIPLNQQPQGTVPDVSGAMLDRFQPMIFILVSTSVVGYDALQVGSVITLQGNIQPFTERDLQLKPEGQRAWTWWWVHALIGVTLSVDDVITYLGANYRVVAKKDEGLGGYQEYQLVQDWTGSGPVTT